MAKFERTLTHEEIGVSLQHTITPDTEPLRRNLPSRKTSEIQHLRLEAPEKNLPILIDFETVTSTAVAPLCTQIDKDTIGTDFEIEVQSPSGEPTNFRTILTSEPNEKRIQSFDIEAPPPILFQWTESLINRSYDNKIFSTISDYYDTDEATAIVEYFKSIHLYLTSDQFLRLLNICAETSVEFREVVGNFYTHEYFARFLQGSNKSKDLDLDSWPRLRQFCSTSSQLRYIPTYTESNLMKEAIRISHISASQSVDTNLKYLWGIEEAFDISKWYPGSLEYKQFVGLVSKAVLERRTDIVEDLVDYWIHSEDIDNLNDKIDEAKSNNQSWRELVPDALKKGGRTSEFILAHFLEEAGDNKDIPILYSVTAYQAAAFLYNKLGQASFVRSSKFQEHYLRGQLLLSNEEYDSAHEELREARELSLEELQAFGEVKFTNLASSWVYLYEARMERFRDRGNFESAVHILEDGLRSVELFEDFKDEHSQNWVQKRISAMLNEVNGDRYLSTQNFKQAKKSYGKAIGDLKSLDQDLDNQSIYLQNRRSGIEAALAESEGEYERAANLYNSIESRTHRENTFVKFHQTRKHFCHTRDAIARRKFSEARACLENITYQSKVLRNEQTSIEFLLNTLEKYESGDMTDIDYALKTIQEISEYSADHLTSDFGYGQDYRPAFIQILAAQRSQSVIENKEFLDQIVDIAINDALKPNNVEEIVNQQGIEKAGLPEQWKGKVPDFITRQIQEVEQTASRNRSTDNHKSQAESLTGILEECTRILVAYHARMQHGDNWPQEISTDGNVTLGTIKNYLNRDVFDTMSWSTKVRELFSNDKFEDIVLEDKRGTIVDVRNDLDHNNKSFVTKEEYDRIKLHIESILSAISNEMPILGVVGEQNAYRAHSVQLLRLGPHDRAEVISDKELRLHHVYFFPYNITDDTVAELGFEQILRCKSEDVIESIESHSNVDFINWE